MPQLDRRQALRLLATLGVTGPLASALSGCSGDPGDDTGRAQAVEGEPVRVGLVVPQSGADQGIGIEIANGFSLFVKNGSGRLGNRRILLSTVDEGAGTDTAKAAVDRLLRDGAGVIVGISNPEALAAVQGSIEAGQVPLLTPSPARSGAQGAKYVWRTGFLTEEPGIALGKWIAEHASGSLAVLAGDVPGVRDDVRAFVDAFKAAGGLLAGEPQYAPAGSTDFSGQFAFVRESNAGAAYCVYSGSAAVGFVKQLRAAGLPAALQVYGPGLLTEGAQLTQQGDAAKSIFTAMNYSPDLNTTENRRFVSDYQKAYDANPSSYAVAAYDAAAVLERAFVLAGSDASPLGINTAIGRLGQVESPRGLWQFNQNRSPQQKWFLRQVKVDGPVLANVLTAELVTLG